MNQVADVSHVRADAQGMVTQEDAPLFSHPDEVLSQQGLSALQKRAILASWVSDARAVENSPSLRQLDNGAIVTIDEVLQALRVLDADERTERPAGLKPQWPTTFARRRSVPRWLRQAVRLHHFDDDDDPPPCPVCAAKPTKRHAVKADGRQGDLHCPRLAVAGLSA